jgi:hypothetical protein
MSFTRLPISVLNKVKQIYYHENAFADEHDYGYLIENAFYTTNISYTQDFKPQAFHPSGILIIDKKQTRIWTTDRNGNRVAELKNHNFQLSEGATISMRRSE